MAIPKFLWAGTACVIAASCTSPMQETASLSETYLTTASGNQTAVAGLPYFLPKTVLPIKIAGDFQILPSKAKTEEKDRKPQDYEYVLTVEIMAPRQIADPNGLLLLRYNAEFATDDEFRLGVSSAGLLSNAKSTSDDRSADVVLKLAELAKEAIKLPTAFARTKLIDQAPAVDQTPDERRIACFKLLRKFTIEDALSISDDSATSKLVDLNSRIIAAMQKDPSATPSIAPAGERPLSGFSLSSFSGAMDGGAPKIPTRNNADIGAHGGVQFRLMAPRQASVSLTTSGIAFQPADRSPKSTCTLQGEEIRRDAIPVLAADPARTFVVDTSRAIFVKKRVDLLVTDGVLTGIEVDKPSELLAIVSLPVDLLKAIVSIPAELLTIKVNNAEGEKKLTAAEVELLKLQIDLLKQKQALEDARQPPAQPAAN
ncbi:MAG: hypothetical protein AB7F36_10400 [Reyranellaceae bacterium]